MRVRGLASILLALAGIMHLLRAILGRSLIVGTWSVPSWVSRVGGIVLLIVAWMLYQE